jgi:Tol biopolymer transport system component
MACGCQSVKKGEVPASSLVCKWGRVVPLTFGAGNDTEAAWSPDGRRVAFQTDVAGDWDLAAVDLQSGQREVVVGGKGHACYPAWTPDGRLVYSWGFHPETAMQAATRSSTDGFGLYLREGRKAHALTRGYWRDYTPSVTGDGAAVYFASTRQSVENSATLWRMALRPGAPAERVLPLDGASVGAVQPSLSAHGRFLVWAQQEGFRQNWRLCAAHATNLQEAVFLTPGEMSAYAPRWSPDGKFIAFTGFRLGDPGWGIYVVEPRYGALVRLDTGRGNSKSPCWSPDGQSIVFENNRSGFYKLYRLPISCKVSFTSPLPSAAPFFSQQVEARLERQGEEVALVAADGVRVTGSGAGKRTFERPAGLDFGADPFYVQMTLVVDKRVSDTRIAAVGHYTEHAMGWQVFIRESGRICFSSRTPEGQYVGVESDEPVSVGKETTVVGVRDANGTLRMSVNGVMQKRRAAGATLSYSPALKVCLGQQWNGGMLLSGKVEAFECGRGTPAGVPRLLTRDQLFAEEQP